MCRRAISANSAAVNIPYGATNSLFGRVHGAVDARSVYTPAEPDGDEHDVGHAGRNLRGGLDHRGHTKPRPRGEARAEAELVDEVAAECAGDGVHVAGLEAGVGQRVEGGVDGDAEGRLAFEHPRLARVAHTGDDDITEGVVGHERAPSMRVARAAR